MNIFDVNNWLNFDVKKLCYKKGKNVVKKYIKSMLDKYVSLLKNDVSKYKISVLK